MYGLKQAGRGWHQELTKVFTHDVRLTQSSIDHSVFYRKRSQEHRIFAVVTDNIVITSKQLKDIVVFKAEVSHHWGLSNLGEIHWYLGFEVKHIR